MESEDIVDVSQMTDADLVDKEKVKKLKCNLQNIYKVLQVAFETLSPAKDANLVVAVGNTGCGKSTMLSSIIFGPDCLQKTQISVEKVVMKRDRKTKQMKEEVKTIKKWVIDQKAPDQIQSFTIGHSDASSMTFLPHFKCRDESSQIMYADIAGLMDTGGDLLEYINCFVNKKLFNMANKVKFLFPITFDSLKEERGGQIIR